MSNRFAQLAFRALAQSLKPIRRSGMDANSSHSILLASLVVLIGCQQAAPPTNSPSAVAPIAKLPVAPSATSAVSVSKQLNPNPAGFSEAASLVTPVPVQQTPVGPPWTPVSVAESFNDRAYPALREWAASSGGFHTAAKFVGLVEGEVQLHKGAGGEVIVPLGKLSAKDQQYVKELIRVDPTANVTIGKVFRVSSSDTLSVLVEDRYQLVHLEGVEAIDADQKIGAEAKDALTAKLQDKHVWIEWHEKNKSDFLIGQIYLDGRNINLELVAEGYARHDRLPRINARMANAELIAQQKRLGVWGDNYAEQPFGFGTPK